jgi:glycosyltransferase involved in cell wall biosynthesis/predicted O-methyltransferase YrrM
MLDLVIVCENPTLHSGFSTVGRQVARSLHARGVRVRYVARFPGSAGAPGEPYEVLEADREGDSSAEAGARLVRTLDAATAAGTSAHGVPLLSIGALWQHAELLAALGQRRLPGVGQVIVYLPVDAAPLPPIVGPTLERADVVVPYNAFGAQVLRRSGVTPRIAAPIPHGVDTDVFAPLADDERRAVRRERFGLGDDELLVGFFGRNCGHKRPDLVLRIFAAWVNGGAARCRGCAALVERPLGPVGGGYGTLARCPHCGAGEGFARQAARPGARLYLHTELLTARERRVSGGWDLERIARRLGVADRVEFEPSLQFGRGVAATELARRMAACDVHMLPYEGGAWELTVLETGACGVPNVITDAAAPPEYAAPFSILVPPMMRVHGPGGARAFMDVGRAVDALQQLSDNREVRRQLGQRGIEVARAHQWDRIGDRWLEIMQRRRPWRRRARSEPAAFDEVADRLRGIQFTNPENGRALYDFILDNKIEDILEIGFHHGVSTCYLAAAIAERGSGHIVTLDQRTSRDKDPNLPQLLDEFGFVDYVTPVFAERSYTWELYRLLTETSTDRASRQRFDFMFHDADHTWDNTSLAFLLGDVMLRPGGWMLFDDYKWTIQASESAMNQRRGNWPEEERRTPAVKEVFRLLIEPHTDYREPILTNNGNWAWVQKRDDETITYPLT